ncbi:hypothetical protein EXN66_Car001013 [Channa argus]|uniref:Uncharacterized protein n=1 Tax=Channa argus TaxID=215402 RepID=A0A6G1QYS1_CHAAH|nr:hypothetical protein EXN66_Car001013 [Channa argus]
MLLGGSTRVHTAHSNMSQTVKGRQASVVLSSVQQTDDGATVSATKHLRTIDNLLLGSNQKEIYFRNESF